MTFETPTEASIDRKRVQRKILAACETGNFSVARTELREYAERYPKEAREIQLDVAYAYNTVL